MTIEVEPRIFACPNCGGKNRLNPLKIASKLDKVRCGSCGTSLFLGPHDPLLEISSTAYEHHLDRRALEMLRRVPGVNSILRFILRELSERRLRMLFLQTAVKVHDKHLTKLHDMNVRACTLLDMELMPELYVMHDPMPNAMAIGVDDPFVVLTSGLLDQMDEDQIRGVIGHELGHIHAGHQLYRTALYLLINLADRLLGSIIPMREAAMFAIVQALQYWSRCSELTADRAQMLVQRNFDRFVHCEMRLAGGSRFTNPDLDAEQFLLQAQEATRVQEENFLNKIYAGMQASNASHPFPVWRAGHMLTWVGEGSYLDILSGNFARKNQEPAPPVLDEEDLEGKESLSPVRKMLDELRGVLGR
ncbi:M48 family metalloprotease [Acanthopleuribacter pedis]|uniref:M48 family metalloprotease n=1 Tax=Acanthopleuribacter pedis TaxID=442870 RepID=A0A8J7Q5K6_9BACT|nr:M48 family metalloprotease [Acanthopleuribacter pedis]MBO1320842.1 M48 family metalloprotease [Acanthopleuribacter pedis]